MDPISVLSLVSNIVQLVDFGLWSVKDANSISAAGLTEDHAQCKLVAEQVGKSCDALISQQGINYSVLEHPKPSVAAVRRTSSSAASSSSEADCDQSHSNTNAENIIAPSATDCSMGDLAARTSAAADKLRDMMESLGITDKSSPQNTRKRKRTVASKLIKGVWNQKEVSRLRSELHELQQTMILRLGAIQNESTSEMLQHLNALSKDAADRNGEQLNSLEIHCTDVCANAAYTMQSSDLQLVQDYLQTFTGRSRKAIACQHVIRSLAFVELNARIGMISDAHASTFDWIFEKDDLGFREWASNKNGIFWITGKPGSGKLTLMKYIAQDPRTRELLMQWAGRERLVIAHHYFWNAGTTMQHSLTGLIRTLLYHIVQQFPDDALGLIPSRFHNGAVALPWTEAELCRALQAIGKGGVHGSRLCLFIDGLDELQEDHIKLVGYLSKLDKCTNIKLCLSSRPWNIFHHTYNKQVDGQLALQELTRDDIMTYVTDEMDASELFHNLQLEKPEECAKLIKNIGDKASGVFLWVFLAVRSMLRGLTNNDNLPILQRRLDQHPATLDAYFRRMFERTEEVYQRHGARILLLAVTIGRGLPLSAPHMLETELDDHEYALHMLPWKGISASSSEDVEEVRRSLDARCGDLLEVVANNNEIAFFHRTAKEFVEHHVIQRSLIERAGSDFDVGLSLGKFELAQLKTLSLDGEDIAAGIEQLLESTKMVASDHLLDYLALLDNLDAEGQAVFASSSDNIPDGVEQTNVYEDSLWCFKVQSTLVNIRTMLQSASVDWDSYLMHMGNGQLTELTADDAEREEFWNLFPEATSLSDEKKDLYY